MGKRLTGIILYLMLMLSVAGCGKIENLTESPASGTKEKQAISENIASEEITTSDMAETEEDEPAEEARQSSAAQNEVKELKLYCNDTEIPVTWEYNNTVSELTEEAAKSDIIVSMSMYGGWEQVGSLGRSYTRNDSRMTAKNGDIVLYNGNQIVLFYGENSWSYTKLGKMDLSESEVTGLLSNGDITLTLKDDK